MRIGLDIMGGDYAPLETTLGALEAQKVLLDTARLVLIGDEIAARKIITDAGGDVALFDFVHSTEVIEMHEHPAKAFQQKQKSSISIGFFLLKEGKLDAFCSAGNTGAMLVGSMFSVKAIPGISRPAISTLVPKENGGIGLLLDVGVNADCKPENLQQFAILGSLYAEHVLHIPNPKVALMSIGEEDEKGNILTKESNQLLRATKGINFVGNIEGRDLFNDKADVVVCDGFTGNIVLKLAESFYSLLLKRKIRDDYFDKFNFESHGGTPILGVNAPVMIGHGISNAKAINSMLQLTKDVVEVQLSQKITTALSLTPETN